MRLSYTECCRLLQLDPGQTHSVATIRRNYLRQAKCVHPDRCPGDDDAKEKFQKLSCAYETLTTSSADDPCEVETDPDGGIDIALYKELFEKLSVQASDFWEHSTEARFLRTLWSTWRAHRQTQQECTSAAASHRSSASSTPTDTASSSDTEDLSSESHPHPIRITLRLPLHDVYHNVLHRVKYTRYSHSDSSSSDTRGSAKNSNSDSDTDTDTDADTDTNTNTNTDTDANTDTSSGHQHEPKHKHQATHSVHTEEVSVLVPAACREFCCYRQGDQLEADGVRGDVVFVIDTIMPADTYRIHPTRKVLQRLVWLDPAEVCYGVAGGRTVEVCGTEVPVCVPPRLYETWNGSPVVNAGSGTGSDTGSDTGPDTDECAGKLAHLFDAGHIVHVPGCGLMTCESGYCENTSAGQQVLNRDVLELVCVVRDAPSGEM